MRRERLKYGKMDWYLVGIYLFLVLFGWINIYSSLHTEEHQTILDFSQRYGMQLVWIISSLCIAGAIITFINPRIYTTLPPLLYFITLILLFSVIFLGKEINGSHSWFVLGSVSFQPAELSKITTSLLLAYIIGRHDFNLMRKRDALAVLAVIFIPILIIIMEKETGSALVYLGYVVILYLFGMSGWILISGLIAILLFVTTLMFGPVVSIIILNVILFAIKAIFRRDLINLLSGIVPSTLLLSLLPRILRLNLFSFVSIGAEFICAAIVAVESFAIMYQGWKRKIGEMRYLAIGTLCAILFIFSTEFIFETLLQPHQKARIENLLGIKEDPMGIGYNVHQSKIAIGSGGFLGKGFLQGTQTKYNFVPEQSTDFIFCTIGEEWGFVGSTIVVICYILLITRLLTLASREQDLFTKVYGCCIAAVFFMHFAINIGMTIGLVPVIGIPLPFISYGGSSLWTFTTMLFIYLRLNLNGKSQ